jgi:transglutaminase-like putative cysteine protease
MNRREFIEKAALTACTTACLTPRRALAEGSHTDRERSFDITTTVEVLKPEGPTRIWVPAPPWEASSLQKVISEKVTCGKGGVATTFNDQNSELRMICASFPSSARPVLTVSTQVMTRDWFVDLGQKWHRAHSQEENLSAFLKPTRHIPTDGIVKHTADKITRGMEIDSQKARAIYEWVVVNTYRDPKIRGCGRGDIRFMLESGDLGGKCADINALFVGLARAAGLPARDVYGIRAGKSALGYKCLGANSENVTKAQHCRAEVYISGAGWFPVDPADVRKVMLEESSSKLDLSDQRVIDARVRLFGSWEMNWIAFNHAQDVSLLGSDGQPLPFLMYPQAETANGRIDCLDPDDFRYQIISHEIGTAVTG